jgi:hypothetical protein
VLTEEGGEQDSIQICVRGSSKKMFLGNEKEAEMGGTAVET